MFNNNKDGDAVGGPPMLPTKDIPVMGGRGGCRHCHGNGYWLHHSLLADTALLRGGNERQRRRRSSATGNDTASKSDGITFCEGGSEVCIFWKDKGGGGDFSLANNPKATMTRRDKWPRETGGVDRAALSVVVAATLVVALTAVDNGGCTCSVV